MDSRIMCSVNNCHYWSSNNICQASQIMVTSDALGNSAPDTYDALQATNASPTPVGKCMETCCKTFVKEGSPLKKADQITKEATQK